MCEPDEPRGNREDEGDRKIDACDTIHASRAFGGGQGFGLGAFVAFARTGPE
jgi:hypothetical protein